MSVRLLTARVFSRVLWSDTKPVRVISSISQHVQHSEPYFGVNICNICHLLYDVCILRCRCVGT